MKVSVVMIDGAFRENVFGARCFADQDFPEGDWEVIWVEHYAEAHPDVVSNPRVKTICLRREGVYHSSHCFNAGIAAAQGEIICVADADQIVPPDFLSRVYEAHARYDKLALYGYRYDERERGDLETLDLAELEAKCVLMNPTNYGGCLTVRRKWLLELNGYEQHPVFRSGYHSNGLDMYTRLKNRGLAIEWDPSLRLYHPWHPFTFQHTVEQEAQERVTAWRRQTMSWKAFEGLDPRQDSPPSNGAAEVLAQELEHLERNGGAPPRLSPGQARSCLILGAGRSGTSMTGGILHAAGYHMGHEFHAPHPESNPKGFFEAPAVNDLNETILKQYDRHPTVYTGGALRGALTGVLVGLRRRLNPRKGQRWLCALGPDVPIRDGRRQTHEAIRHLVSHMPFAYKDPRLSYTLPVWEPFLPDDIVFLCIFRHPVVTARSILKEVRTRSYLAGLRMNESIAYDVYENMYAHILAHYARRPEPFVFMHYDQAFDGSALGPLGSLLGVELDADFVEPALKRTRQEGSAPASAMAIYAKLCALASYRGSAAPHSVGGHQAR